MSSFRVQSLRGWFGAHETRPATASDSRGPLRTAQCKCGADKRRDHNRSLHQCATDTRPYQSRDWQYQSIL